MSDTAAQPMISVKKADGSVVRMTLAEFQAYRQEQTKTIPEPVVSPAELEEDRMPVEEISTEETPVEDVPEAPINLPIVDEDLPMVVGEQELTTTTPVPDFFENNARAQVTSWEDNHSLLEDEGIKTSESTKELPELPQNHDELLGPVLQHLSFFIGEQEHGRLRALIRSRMKEIRTDDDIIAVATRTIDQGGLGLSEERAQELVRVILEAQHLTPSVIEPPARSVQLRTEEENIPEIQPEMPIEPIEPEEPIEEIPEAPEIKQVAAKQQLDTLIRESSSGEAYSFASPSGKPVVRDAETVMVQRRAMGPVDEFRSYTIEELHRLGKGEQIVTRILQKLEVLKAESYLLYQDAVQAWYQSPAYAQYENLLLASVNEVIPLRDVVAEIGEDMSFEDVQAIIQINSVLAI